MKGTFNRRNGVIRDINVVSLDNMETMPEVPRVPIAVSCVEESGMKFRSRSLTEYMHRSASISSTRMKLLKCIKGKTFPWLQNVLYTVQCTVTRDFKYQV